MLAGLIVGICAGLAGVLLNGAIVWLDHALRPARGYWWAFVLPGLGAALSSIFLERVVNEGAGHGVPEVIYSVSRRGGLLRLRSGFSRLVSSCLTIGSGGSAGPEAPVVMSGSAIGSNIARLFSMNDRQRTTLVGCGAAAAIGSIFNAPIAGLIFTMEVILGRWSAAAIFPIAVASVAGTEVSRQLQGNRIPFNHQPFTLGFMDIVASVGLAVFAAGASLALTHAIRTSHHLWDGAPGPKWTRAALGGFLVGGIGLYMPVILGEGYHAISEMIEGAWVPALGFVALAAVVKVVVTSLTLGSGGSGGIFAPCLVVGALVGVAYHGVLAAAWPAVGWVDAGAFALLGMAGLVSGMLQAPLTALFLIVEITGSYGVVLPLILVSVISTTLCNLVERSSFYLKDLEEHGQLLRPGTDARVLTDLRVNELLEHDVHMIREDMPLRELVDVIKQSHRNHFPVENQAGEFVGMVHLDHVRPYLFSPELYDAVMVYQIMDDRPLCASVDDHLPEVLGLMDRHRKFTLPVVDNERFVGMISKGTLLNQYRKELIVQTSP